MNVQFNLNRLSYNMYQEKIQAVLKENGKLSVDPATLGLDDDLYNSGLTSLTTVNVMLALEDEFDVEFSDDMLGRKTFQSIGAIHDAIEDLLA